MHFVLNGNKALDLDKFLSITQSDRFTMEILEDLVVFNVVQEDFSNFTIIKINHTFFDEINTTEQTQYQSQIKLEDDIDIHTQTNKYTLPMCSFYQAYMKTVKVFAGETVFKLYFEFKHPVQKYLCYDNLKYTSMDIDFEYTNSVMVDISAFRNILYSFHAKYADITISDNTLTWTVQNNTITLDIENKSNSNFSIKVSWIHMKRIFDYQAYTYAQIALYEDNHTVQILFRKEHLYIESYLSNYTE